MVREIESEKILVIAIICVFDGSLILALLSSSTCFLHEHMQSPHTLSGCAEPADHPSLFV